MEYLNCELCSLFKQKIHKSFGSRNYCFKRLKTFRLKIINDLYYGFVHKADCYFNG